jgi:hypothetical protein
MKYILLFIVVAVCGYQWCVCFENLVVYSVYSPDLVRRQKRPQVLSSGLLFQGFCS